MLGQSIIRSSIVLVLFACITAGVIAITYVTTKDRIDLQRQQAQARALLETFSADTHDNDLLTDTAKIQSDLFFSNDNSDKQKAHIARKNNQIVGIIFPVVAPQGYGGRIRLLVGIRADGQIAGVRAIQHKETPGLGDKIELKKSDWVLSFNGKSLVNPQTNGWQVIKDGGEFDQFTGATITPRAVVKAVYNTLQYFNTNKDNLFTNN